MKCLMPIVALAVVAVVSAGKAKNPKHCESAPCQNGGKCYNGRETYYCRCAFSYYGKDCENKVKRRCDYGNPCQNGGECRNRRFWRYRCNCPAGYTGRVCQHKPCDAEPCMNGGVCSNVGDSERGYTCKCPDDFQGYNCGEEVPPPTYNCEDNNPCSVENVKETQRFYYPHDEPTKFVQCSEWGQCNEMPCAPGTEWDVEENTCNWPSPK